MPTVVFVCTANICRSPVAAALFREWLKQQGVPGQWQVLSAGTWAQPGQPASHHSRSVLLEQGVDLGPHRSRPIDRELLSAADLVVCMTRSHCEALMAEFPDCAERVHLLSALAGPAFDVADPYGGPRAGYVAMVKELTELVAASGEHIVARANRH